MEGSSQQHKQVEHHSDNTQSNQPLPEQPPLNSELNPPSKVPPSLPKNLRGAKPATILQLQRLYGNRAVTRLIAASKQTASGKPGSITPSKVSKGQIAKSNNGSSVIQRAKIPPEISGLGKELDTDQRFEFAAEIKKLRDLQVLETIKRIIEGENPADPNTRSSNAYALAFIRDQIDTLKTVSDLSVGAIPTNAVQDRGFFSNALNLELIPWDGAESSPNITAESAQKARIDLKSRMLKRLEEVIQENPKANTTDEDWQNWPALNMAQFEGVANIAKKLVDRKYGRWKAGEVVLYPKRHRFAEFKSSGPNKNLFNATVPEEREQGKRPIEIIEMAEHLAEGDLVCQQIRKDHNFDPKRGGVEQLFYQNEIILPTVQKFREQLRIINRYGNAFGDFATGNIFVGPALMYPDKTEDTELLTLWRQFPLFVHEYIHTLEDPISKALDNRVILEGFCDMFAQDVTFAALATLPENPEIVQAVEGTHKSVFVKALFEDIARDDVKAPDYEPYVEKARAIRNRVGAEAVEASYFLGYVHLIGMTPGGKLK